MRLLNAGFGSRSNVIFKQQAGCAGLKYAIADDQAVARQLLAHPVSQAPQGVADLQGFLFTASAQLPVSAQPFQLIKAKTPHSADVVYLSGDCFITRAVTAVLDLSETVSGQFALSVITFCILWPCFQQSHVSQYLQVMEVALSLILLGGS